MVISLPIIANSRFEYDFALWENPLWEIEGKIINIISRKDMDSRTSFVVLFSIIFNVQVMLHMQKQNWVYKKSNIS